MILPENYVALGRSLGRAIIDLLGPADDPIVPDAGYVFVYTSEGLQVFDHLNRAVQVPEIFANS